MFPRTKMPGHVSPGHMFPGQLGLHLMVVRWPHNKEAAVRSCDAVYPVVGWTTNNCGAISPVVRLIHKTTLPVVRHPGTLGLPTNCEFISTVLLIIPELCPRCIDVSQVSALVHTVSNSKEDLFGQRPKKYTIPGGWLGLGRWLQILIEYAVHTCLERDMGWK